MSMFDDHVISEGRRGEQEQQEAQEDEWDAHPIHDDDSNAEAEQINNDDDDVDHIFKGIRDNHGEVLNLATKRSKPTKLKKTKSTTMDGNDDVEDEVVRRRIEKKRFMSSKADVILGSDVSVRHSAKNKKKKESSSSNRGKDLMMEDKEEFKKLSREIQHFGTCAYEFYYYVS